jgi:hypothetical protein
VEDFGGATGTASLVSLSRKSIKTPPTIARSPYDLGKHGKMGKKGNPLHRSFQTIRRGVIVNMNKFRLRNSA